MTSPILITVFTGFLGAGKTTTILSLLPQLPQDYKVVLLKNEFGDVEVDSQLAKQSSLAAVSEILNGCMCCILVGQMKNALLEIKDSFKPDRVIIEASGSAFPATLALQIRDLEKEASGAFKLDSIVTVIDAENFTGYEDTSPTARMQAAYTDVLLVNKWELVSERQLETVMDHLFTLNEATPKIKSSPKSGGVDVSLVFGLDSTLYGSSASEEEKAVWSTSNHHDEVETVTIRKGTPKSHIATNGHIHDEHCDHHNEPSSPSNRLTDDSPVDSDVFSHALEGLNKETIYRVKGFIRYVVKQGSESTGVHIVNWAFGRSEITPINEGLGDSLGKNGALVLTVMGERGEVRGKAKKFAEMIGAYVT